MWNAEASRSRKCLFLENKKQNTFASKNNHESMRVSCIHNEKKVLESTKETIDKSQNFID